MPTTNVYMNTLYPATAASDGAVTLTNQTTTVVGPALTNERFKGIIVNTNITAITAGSLTVAIQGLDPLNPTVSTGNILVGTALVGTGMSTLKVYPGLTASANAVASDILPALFRLSLTVATGPLTATISYTLIP